MSHDGRSEEEIMVIDDSDDATAFFGKNEDGTWREIPTPKIDSNPPRFVKPSELPDHLADDAEA